MSAIDTSSLSYQQFPEFYDHPFINRIASCEKWSITQPSTKMPLDMFALSQGVVAGCKPTSPYAMCSLPDTVRIVESVYHCVPANHALNMDVAEDDFILLDIEPACPAALRRKFMQLPYLYAEKSLSGKGIHMIMPVLPEYAEYPAVLRLQKMQEAHRYYEIMFAHWVTFTRNMLPEADPNADDAWYHEIFTQLAKRQVKKSSEAMVFAMDDQHDVDVSTIPGADDMIAYATNGEHEYARSLDDFNQDMSAFVFGTCSHAYTVMKRCMRTPDIVDLHHEYTPQERTLILYAIVKMQVPDRPKNHARRGNTTWLMWQCQRLVSLRLGEETDQNEKGDQ